jgi:hypothetical protein
MGGEQMRRTVILGLAAALAAAASAPAEAQTYPSRTIRMVVPFGPGSGTDIGTRLLAQHLGAALGQTIVVENRPGATGTIAAQAVANAAPDGYTLLMGTNSTHGGNSATQRNLPYDPLAPEVEAYAARLAAAGRLAGLSRYEGVMHGFFAQAGRLAKPRAAQEEVCTRLAEAIGGTGTGPPAERAASASASGGIASRIARSSSP